MAAPVSKDVIGRFCFVVRCDTSVRKQHNSTCKKDVRKEVVVVTFDTCKLRASSGFAATFTGLLASLAGDATTLVGFETFGATNTGFGTFFTSFGG